MRQILYVSDSLIGSDQHALDRLMLQARHNNGLDGISGLLWTDGRRFAQVIEGDERALAELMAKLRADPRHARLTLVQENPIDERQFGDWSMVMPATDSLARQYEQRMLRHLHRLTDSLSDAFRQIIAGGRSVAAG